MSTQRKAFCAMTLLILALFLLVGAAIMSTHLALGGIPDHCGAHARSIRRARAAGVRCRGQARLGYSLAV